MILIEYMKPFSMLFKAKLTANHANEFIFSEIISK